MSPRERDRDAAGRPQSARPRDRLGRPLPYGSRASAAGSNAADAELARLESADYPALLAGAQRLLDAGRPFEAHEVLEAAWKRAPSEERGLWRALAQLAVGLTHHLRGNEQGARALFARAAEGLDAWHGAISPHAIDIAGLALSARRFAAGDPPGWLRLTR